MKTGWLMIFWFVGGLVVMPAAAQSPTREVREVERMVARIQNEGDHARVVALTNGMLGALRTYGRPEGLSCHLREALDRVERLPIPNGEGGEIFLALSLAVFTQVVKTEFFMAMLAESARLPCEGRHS
jgi:hypothetical protein